MTVEQLDSLYASFLIEAVRLRQKYAHQITILIGFESEYIRPSNATVVRSLLQKSDIDFFVGSLHHVGTVPIDFDRSRYEKARTVAGGTEAALFAAYFDEHFQMLQALRPPVVGHFDLIRLLSDDKDVDIRTMDNGSVWGKVLRNLQSIKEQGGLIEINSSALRKGCKEPYPGRQICQAWHAMGGRFTLGDDAHGVAQVGLNFGRCLDYLDGLGVEKLHFLERDATGTTLRVASARLRDIKGGAGQWYETRTVEERGLPDFRA